MSSAPAAERLWIWTCWRFAGSVFADGTTRSDESGSWIRLFGKTWWLMERAQ
jgi:hypothetical protein